MLWCDVLWTVSCFASVRGRSPCWLLGFLPQSPWLVCLTNDLAACCIALKTSETMIYLRNILVNSIQYELTDSSIFQVGKCRPFSAALNTANQDEMLSVCFPVAVSALKSYLFVMHECQWLSVLLHKHSLKKSSKKVMHCYILPRIVLFYKPTMHTAKTHPPRTCIQF